MAFDEDSSASGHDEPWIQWFCGLKGHEMFCEVERGYIEDGFNLYGLRACVPNFSDCLDLILDRIGPDDSDDSHLTQSACTLYGLIHQRYIITAHGLDAMYNKYTAKEFGTCLLLQCKGQPVLPVGLKDEVAADSVKLFCPKCQNIYHPPPSRSRNGCGNIDGAAFGTTFPHLFLMTFSNLVPEPLSHDSIYTPRVFGFRVHKSARQRQGTTASIAVLANCSNNAQSHNDDSKKNQGLLGELNSSIIKQSSTLRTESIKILEGSESKVSSVGDAGKKSASIKIRKEEYLRKMQPRTEIKGDNIDQENLVHNLDDGAENAASNEVAKSDLCPLEELTKKEDSESPNKPCLGVNEKLAEREEETHTTKNIRSTKRKSKNNVNATTVRADVSNGKVPSDTCDNSSMSKAKRPRKPQDGLT